jgi:hypothetical protein
MFPVMFAATTLSLIHFTLSSGANVELSYAPTYIPEAQAIRTGVPMAETIWKDFCGPKPGRRCDAGQYYTIDLSLLVAKGLEKETFNSCDGSISYKRPYSYNEVRPANFEQFGFYNCYSKGDDPELRIARAATELPAIVARPRAASTK